jgi:hypothetical protein
MNAVERVLERELVGLLDRLAESLPQGAPTAVTANASIRARLDEADTRLSEIRSALLADYGRWRRALEDVENLWALASWRAMALGAASPAQEPVEQATALAAA